MCVLIAFCTLPTWTKMLYENNSEKPSAYLVYSIHVLVQSL